MNVSDLGGVFKSFSGPEELPENLRVIYDAFIADPDADLKLDKDPEYYGPIIADYHRKNSDKWNKHIWNDYTKDFLRADKFQNFESIKFLHNRYPDKIISTWMDYADITLDEDVPNANLNTSKIRAMLNCNVCEYPIFNCALLNCRFDDMEFLIKECPDIWETYKSEIAEKLHYLLHGILNHYNDMSVKSYISILQFLKDHGYDITSQIDHNIDCAIRNNLELSKFFFENMTPEFRLEYAFWAISQSSNEVYELIQKEGYYKDLHPKTFQMLNNLRKVNGK